MSDDQREDGPLSWRRSWLLYLVLLVFGAGPMLTLIAARLIRGHW